MHKFGVQLALEHVGEARAQWGEAQREFQSSLDKVMRVLIHEAVANFMSAEDIARFSGLTKVRVRAIMRANGLNQKEGKRVLSELAARALRENADLLGMDPNQIDLTSPLAYLPMGSVLRAKIQEQRVAKVTDLSALPDLGERRADCKCCIVVDEVSLRELIALAEAAQG